MRYIIFYFLNLIWLQAVSQTEEDTSYYYELQIKGECNFDLKIPREIDAIDSLIINKYGVTNERKYMFYVKFITEKEYKIHFFNVKSNNGEICIDNSLVKIKILELAENIKIEHIICPHFPMTLFVPLKLNGGP